MADFEEDNDQENILLTQNIQRSVGKNKKTRNIIDDVFQNSVEEEENLKESNTKLSEILKSERSRNKSEKLETESIDQKSNYIKMAKMIQSLKSDGMQSEKFSYPINSVIKSMEKQQKKEKEKLEMVGKIMDKLNDFQKEFQKDKNENIEEEEENINEIEENTGIKIMYSENQMNLNNMHDRIFWSKEKIKSTQEKFRQAKISIEEKTEKDFSGLKKLIDNGDTEGILSALLNEHFKAFYELEFPKRALLEYMLLRNQPSMLLEVLKDSYYQWNYNYIFDFLTEQFEKTDVSQGHQELQILVMNIVSFDLYNKSLFKLLAWLIGSYNIFDAFRILINKHDELREKMQNYKDFLEDYNIANYIENEETYAETLMLCLKNKFEKLAKALVSFRYELRNKEIIDCAIEQECIDFLKFIWENQALTSLAKNANSHKENQNSQKFKNKSMVKRRSMFEVNIEESNNYIFNNGSVSYSLSYLIDKLSKTKSKKNNFIHEIISSWNYIENDQGFLKTLIDNECFDDVSTLIRRFPNGWNFNKTHLETAIVKKQVELIVYFLKVPECRNVLNDTTIQELIVEKYLKGSKIYYGAEMLSYILKNNWKMDLTEELIKKIRKTIKTKSILECHSPLLTCFLLSEFMIQIGETSINYKIITQNIVKQLIEFSCSIQESNPDEKYVKFLMSQKDTKGRSVLQIAADNNYLNVLKTPELGTIIQKMWNGRLSSEGLFEYSSLSMYLGASYTKSDNPFDNFEILNNDKIYFHQLNLWKESCSLRYWPESVSTILLIILYNIFIYYLVEEDKEDIVNGILTTAMLRPHNQLNLTLQSMMVFYVAWVCCIVLNIPLQIIFCHLSKRKYRLDGRGILDICTFVSAWFLFINTTKIFPLRDSDDNILDPNYNGYSTNAIILRGLILSFNDIFVWLRITGILLTFKNFGPLIRIIYFLSLVIAKYLLIYSFFLTGSVAVFVSIFFQISDQFSTFSDTFAVLFTAFLSNFNVFNFDSYKWLGAIMVLAFVVFSCYMLCTFLIAAICNLYSGLRIQADALHRIVLISYYRRYKWNKDYGYLIFLTTPLNIINYFALLMSLCFKDKELFNTYACRIYYLVFYFPYILVPQILYSSLIIPLCYMKGILKVINFAINKKSNTFYKIMNCLYWIVFGLFFILAMLIRDLYLSFKTMFKNFEFVSYEKSRIQKHISIEDIRIFLQYIHNRPVNDPCDLHSIFLNYIEYDIHEKAEKDLEFKEKKNYFQKIQSSSFNPENQNPKQHSAIFFLNNRTFKKHQIMRKNYDASKNEELDDGKSLMSSFLRRNLIIIEILENFLIDDGSDNYIVDVKKLKLLFPKTMNIDNNYIKKIVNTDINSISRAIKKLKNEKKKKTGQNNLVNKLVGSVVRLDSFVDGEYRDPLASKNERNRHQYELEENENEFYNDLLVILEEVQRSVHSSIKTTENKLNRAENKKMKFKTLMNDRRTKTKKENNATK